MAKGDAGDQVAGCILIVETFEQVAHDIGAIHIFNKTGVNRRAFIAHAVGKGLVRGERFACFGVCGVTIGVERTGGGDQYGGCCCQ